MIIEGKGRQTVVQDGGRLLLVVATPEMKLTWPGLRTKELDIILSSWDSILNSQDSKLHYAGDGRAHR